MFIPNSFQTPNLYVDRLMALLTPEEYVVLSYAVRRILGFHKRQDRLSLRQFVEGIANRAGERLDGGTGLCKDAARRALDGLQRHRILLRVAENDPHANEGAAYALQLDPEAVAWNELHARRAARQAQHARHGELLRRRYAAERESRETESRETESRETESREVEDGDASPAGAGAAPTPSVAHLPGWGVADPGGVGGSHSHTCTQGNPEENQVPPPTPAPATAPAAAAPASPRRSTAVEALFAYFGRPPTAFEVKRVLEAVEGFRAAGKEVGRAELERAAREARAVCLAKSREHPRGLGWLLNQLADVVNPLARAWKPGAAGAAVPKKVAPAAALLAARRLSAGKGETWDEQAQRLGAEYRCRYGTG